MRVSDAHLRTIIADFCRNYKTPYTYINGDVVLYLPKADDLPVFQLFTKPATIGRTENTFMFDFVIIRPADVFLCKQDFEDAKGSDYSASLDFEFIEDLHTFIGKNCDFNAEVVSNNLQGYEQFQSTTTKTAAYKDMYVYRVTDFKIRVIK